MRRPFLNGSVLAAAVIALTWVLSVDRHRGTEHGSASEPGPGGESKRGVHAREHMPTPVFVASPSPDAGDEVGARAKAVRRERRERGLNAFLGQPIDPGIGVFELKPPPLDDPAAKALKDEKAMEIAASRVTVTSAELTKIKGLWTKYLEEMQSSATGKESATVMGALQESAEIMDRHASALSDLLGHERAIQWRQAVNRARRLELPKEQHGHNNQPHPSAARPSAPAP